MRLDGIFGALIVHSDSLLVDGESLVPPNVMLLQDWFDEDTTTLRVMNPFAPRFRGTGEMALQVFDRDYSVDGVELSAYAYDSTLINGRGRARDDVKLPLTVFTVQPTFSALISAVNTGGEFFYEVMVDSHRLFIVSLDSRTLAANLEVDSFIIAPGERVDFVVLATQPDVTSYWVRAELIRQGTGLPIVEDDVIKGGLAILRYEGASSDDPTSTRRSCSAAEPCTTFNCPFAGFRANQYKSCMSLDDVTNVQSNDELQQQYGVNDVDFEEYFLNWGFPIGSSINARKFYAPTAPFSGPNSNNVKQCNEEDCNANGCFCTFMLDVPFNETVQLVLSNLQPGAPFLAHHSVYLHGHSFTVLKVGYPEFDPVTGLWTQANTDVICNNALCTQPSWNGSSPALNTDRPVVKNTVVIPARGYVVIRFR